MAVRDNFAPGEVLLSADLNDTFSDKLTKQGYAYNSTVYFTSSGTFTKATYPWLRAIRVRLVGAGGGAGGCAATGAGQVSYGTGGGGAAYAEKFITDIAGLSASVTVTVGSGGAGGAAGANNGSTGGSSSFGALLSANAGSGGLGQAPVTPPHVLRGGFSSGTTSGADLTISGSGSGPTVVAGAGIVFPGVPGSSHLGLAQVSDGTVSGRDGNAQFAFGAGGNGGLNTQSEGTARAGGAGGPGIVIVELYA
jgi:hypothetical protein